MDKYINKKQQGFLLIVAIIIIIIISAFATVIVYIFTSSVDSGIKYSASKQAFYAAESGLQFGLEKINQPNFTCEKINALYPNPIAFGQGQFQISTVHYHPVPSTTLNSAIDATTTTIPLSSTTSYADRGRIVIGQEAIDYNGKSGNLLINAQRGMAGSTATSHNAGSKIKQNQCVLSSTGATPNFNNPRGKHTLTENIIFAQNIWAVGAKGTILQWNNIAWENYTPSPTDKALNAVSLIDNGKVGFAVGEAGTIIKYINNNWVSDTSPTSEPLNGIATVSTSNAWAVGDNGSILHWDGNNWQIYTHSLPSTNLNAVVMSEDGLLGFAVGDSGTIFKYNGTNWQIDTSPTTDNLEDTMIISANQAWATGGNGVILKWNDSSGWQQDSSPVSTNLNSIDIIDNEGWIVGGGQHNIRYNGTNWSTLIKPSADNLNATKMFAIDDAWAAGVAGKLMYWDGNSWESVSSPTNNEIYDFSKSQTKIMFMWNELFN